MHTGPLFASYLIDTLPNTAILQHVQELRQQNPYEKFGIVCLDANNCLSYDLSEFFDVVHCIKRKSGCFCFTEAEFRAKTKDIIYISSKIFVCSNSHSYIASTIKIAQKRSIPYEVLRCL